MKFYYQAVDAQGNKTTGTIDSSDPDVVGEILERKGLTPLRIQTTPFGIAKKKKQAGLFGPGTVSGKERIVFIRQMATLLEAGCPVTRAFEMIVSRAESIAAEKLATEMKEAVEGGQSISQAMAQHKDVFSGMHIGMAAAGDEGGFLPTALGQVAAYEEGQAKLRGQLIHAITYPAFMVAVMVICTVVLFKFVVPSILAIVTQSGGELPLPTRMLIAVSDGMEAHSVNVLIALALAGYGYWSYIQSPSGRKFHDRMLLSVPLLGGITRKVVVSRICRILAMLLGGGVGVVRAIEIAAGTAQNIIVEGDLMTIIDKVKGGETLSACFEVSDTFPRYVASMVQLGEESGTLDNMLSKLANEYEDDYQSQMKGAVALVEPMMIAVMGALIGFVVIAIFLPMANMSSNI